MATSDSKLDQIVKGAPPPNISPSQIAESAKHSANRPAAPQLPTSSSNVSTVSNDPRDSLPSSPPQIYLNLLILESSLRLQYLSLRARLRVNLLLLTTLLLWNATFTYLLFFHPREDGSGVGGSVYWAVETIEKLGWCSGVVTICLFWGTGMYERGVRWPRKFVGTTNRGLRGFNMKVVVVRDSFLKEVLGWLGMLDPAGWVREERVQFQVLPRDIEAASMVSGSKEHQWSHHAIRHGLVEEDIAPSGDVLKLLLLPKPFSPDFREGWENYRLEYWDRENARRGELRKLYKSRIREVARREGGWIWWTGWRGWSNFRPLLFLSAGKTRRQVELEKMAIREKPSAEQLLQRKRNSALLQRGESHSRSSSRSSTPTPEPEAPHGRPRKPGEQPERPRRGSSAASQRRLKRAGALPASSRLSATETVLMNDDIVRPLEKRNSTISTSSKESEDGVVVVKKERDSDDGVEVKREPAEG